MNFFDDEQKIIDKFQMVLTQDVFFPRQTKDAVTVFKAVHNSENWGKWKNNSGKADPPPDFLCEEYNMMMEVMRVDDHAHYNEKRVLVNPVNQRESMLQKEVRERILSENPGFDLSGIDIMINAISGLPTNEDHNYKFYYENFKRVLDKHIKNIPLYKANHPDKKLVFFVFDESTGYLVTDAQTAQKEMVAGEFFYAEPVWHFFDKKFIAVFRNSDIDYLIWYAPNKMFHGAPIQPPEVCVFDVKKYKYKRLFDYPVNLIVSSEV
jgi:hypothetical protein